MDKRELLQSALSSAALFTLAPFRSALADGAFSTRTPVVETSHGKVAGSVKNGVAIFKGIPYGAPTAGKGRFMPPAKPSSWTGIKSTVAYGDSCPQVPLGTSPYLKKGEINPAAPPSAMQRQLGTMQPRNNPVLPQSEDCLVLNVWTASTTGKRQPVMVWLHGGGFAVGSGSSPNYDGTHFARRRGVVVVTINHRLTAFGHLYLGELGGEQFAQSGNAGMLDIVAALQWVRDNIAAFGGDPGNVTIFGESGGAGKVSVICAIPAAKGLFHKAIMQSGPCLQIADKARGTAIARQVLKDLGLTPAQIPLLQAMDAKKFIASAADSEVKVVPRIIGHGPEGLMPIVDGSAITHDPFHGSAAPESRDVIFMVGSTKDEGTTFAGPLPGWGTFTEADVTNMAKSLAGKRSADAVALYKTLHPNDSPSYLLSDIITDGWMRQAANTVAELKVKQGAAPVYVYMLEWEVDPVIRSPHSTDVSLVFGTYAGIPAMAAAPGAAAVSEQMNAAWAAFAHTGNPNSKAVPQWPAYDTAHRSNMIFNTKSRVENDYGSRARRFWEAS